MEIKRGQLWYIDRNQDGILQNGRRPWIIVSNDIANHYSPFVTVVPLTTACKKPLPTHCQITSSSRLSIALCEQMQIITRESLLEYAGELTWEEMRRVNTCLLIQLGIL